MDNCLPFFYFCIILFYFFAGNIAVALEATNSKKASIVFFNLSENTEGSPRIFSGMPWMTIENTSEKGKKKCTKDVFFLQFFY